jgi:hypothetical protein
LTSINVSVVVTSPIRLGDSVALTSINVSSVSLHWMIASMDTWQQLALYIVAATTVHIQSIEQEVAPSCFF